MLYTTEFKKQLLHAYFLHKVRLTVNQFEEEKTRAKEFYEKHYCENNADGHHFQKFAPHLGCVKMVCKFCAEESRDKLFQPSLNSFKGRTFQFKRKDFTRPPRDYRCGKNQIFIFLAKNENHRRSEIKIIWREERLQTSLKNKNPSTRRFLL